MLYLRAVTVWHKTKQTFFIYNINAEEFTALENLCKKFPKLFYKEGDNLTFTNLVKHKIQTTDEIPLHSKPFRYSPVERQEIQRQITNLLEQDIIRHSHSPWGAPIFLVSRSPTLQVTKNGD